MAESTLTCDLSYLRTIVTEVVYGGDGNYDGLLGSEQARVNRIIQSGLRMFYHPHQVVQGIQPHAWSFLRPKATLSLNAAYSTGTVTIVAGVVTLAGGTFPSWSAAGVLLVDGTDYDVDTRDSDTQVTLTDLTVTASAGTSYEIHQDDYDLPDDFFRLIGRPTFANADNTSYDLEVLSEAWIRQQRQYDNLAPGTSSQPYGCAVRQKTFSETVGQRYELMFYPRVINDATLTYRYEIRPSMPTLTNKYPHGASDHSETICAAVLAAAEMATDEVQGVRWGHFVRCLTNSVSGDSWVEAPVKMMYNADTSDYLEAAYGPHRTRDTVNSVNVPHNSNP
jgi:hypothetical protein